MREALLETLRINKLLLIVTGLLAVVSVALFVTVTIYQNPAIMSAQLKWNDLRSKVAAAGRGDVTTVYKQGQADVHTFMERIPLKRQFPQVLGELMESATANGVLLGALTYKPELVNGEKLLAYGLTMKINGKYAAVKSFLADQLNSKELIVVDKFSMTNSDAFEEDITMDLHMTVFLREGA